MTKVDITNPGRVAIYTAVPLSEYINEYDTKNNKKHVLWAQRRFENHHQTFHDRCPEKNRTPPENMGPLVGGTKIRKNPERSGTSKPHMISIYNEIIHFYKKHLNKCRCNCA